MQLLAGLVFCVFLVTPALAAGEAPVVVTPKTGETFNPTTVTIPEDKTNYLVMIDAGSSGCRVRAFKYGTVDNRLIIQPFQVKKDGKDVQWEVKPDSVPPLHKVATVGDKGVIDQTGKTAIDTAIQTLVTEAKKVIPQPKQAGAYVSLMATAGMRLLKGAQRNAIMREVRASLRKGPFKTLGRRTAYVLPGEDEGLFTWLTINYLKNTLTEDNDEKIDHFYMKEKEGDKLAFRFQSTAVVEVGGASTQVAFIAGSEPLAHSYHYNVDDLDLTLYATSYMNFGNDAARANVAKAVGTENPCGVTGVAMEGVASKWDQAKCDAAIKQHALLMGEKCTQQTCAFDGRYMPKIPATQSIALVGTFTKAAQSLGCLAAKDKIACLGTKSAEVCAAANEDKAVELIKVNDPKFDKKYLPGMCFMGRYTYLMLTAGLRFDEKRAVDFADKLSGANIGWEYGAAIFFVKMIERFDRRRQSLTALGVIPAKKTN